MSELFPPTLDDQIASVEREIAQRLRVYPRQVAAERMTQAAADRELARMRAVLSTLQGLGAGRRGFTLVVGEADRQLVLLALAVLSLASPGFDDALNLVALKIDEQAGGRAVTYEEFRELRTDTTAELAALLRAERTQR